jgi:acetyl-CoA/propionyl-CoA carboxylase biotin carboxyl carrier protein
MLSKVIAWGTDRKAALDKLDAALERYTVLGIDTNVEYLRLLINDDDVRAGRLDTTLIDRKMPELEFREIGGTELTAAALRLWLGDVVASAPRGGQTRVRAPWDSARGWRLGAPAAWRTSFGLPGGAMATVAITPQGDGDADDGRALVRVDDGPERPVRVLWPARADVITFEMEGQQHTFAIGESPDPHAGAGNRREVPTRVYVGSSGWSCGLEVLTRESRLERVLAAVEREEGAADPEVRSPMPGTVVSVAVKDGDTVESGQVLVSVEAMKMEHQLVAEVAGTVHISVATGDLVKADQVVATIHAEQPATHDPAEERKEA